MDEFYNRYNISKTHLANLLNICARTIDKYENNEKLKPNTRSKIDLAIDVIMTNNIKFPKFKPFPDEITSFEYKREVEKMDGVFKILYALKDKPVY